VTVFRTPRATQGTAAILRRMHREIRFLGDAAEQHFRIAK
jgi:hypothetical protein